MPDEELINLSACFDGEPAGAAPGALEAALAADPALHGTLAAWTKFNEAAGMENVPPAALDSEAIWQSIIARATEGAPESAASARFDALAAAENGPLIADERFNSVWKHVTVRRKARDEFEPRVEVPHWHGVWKSISARTTLPDVIDAAEKRPARPKRPETVVRPHFSTWLLGAGVGVAAAGLIAFGLPSFVPSAPAPQPSAWNATASAVSMSIPEAQDENYGVRVRFVPGSSDPVVTLYYKNAPGNARSILDRNDP